MIEVRGDTFSHELSLPRETEQVIARVIALLLRNLGRQLQ